MNDADSDLARQQAIEVGEAHESIIALSRALRDALLCFTFADSVVTPERLEAWGTVLIQHGKFDECPLCNTPTSGGICASCAGVIGEK